jgi:threonine/homoserine/homoserine lactone efflux protein
MDETQMLKRLIFGKQVMIVITTVFGIFEAYFLLLGIATANTVLILISGAFLLWMAYVAAKDQQIVEGAKILLKQKGG